MADQVYLTEYLDGYQRKGDRLTASSWEEAERIARARGRGETVRGILAEEIDAGPGYD